MKLIIINPKILLNKKRGEINDVIDQALIKWLQSNSFNPIVLSNLTIKQSKKKLNYLLRRLNPKGIVLSGGNEVQKKSIRYLMQSFLINYSKINKIPLLGICQGMQMLGIKYGSKLIKVKNHVKKKHKLLNFSNETFPAYSNSFHDFSLKNCPKNFIITTKSIDGNIESIKHKFLPCEGWMWHPERDAKVDQINNFRIKKLFK